MLSNNNDYELSHIVLFITYMEGRLYNDLVDFSNRTLIEDGFVNEGRSGNQPCRRSGKGIPGHSEPHVYRLHVG